MATADSFDVALMTSHVAQVFTTDDEWTGVLTDLRRALVPGGRLVFDSRDPAARRWERWNPADSRRHLRLPDGRSVDAWTEVTEIRDGTVSFTHHYRFPTEKLEQNVTLRFRGEDELRTSLVAHGFTVDRVHGGWHREPVGAPAGELVVIARSTEH